MSPLPVEQFTLSDANLLADLAASVGWRDTPADWRVVLSVGCVVGLREQGAPVAVAARFDFGGVWSIGKVIVHPEHQGRGHARRILGHLLDAARPLDTHVTLIATPQGEPVYRHLGFRRVGTVHKLLGLATSEPVPGVCALDARTLGAAMALDREVFGADRAALLVPRVQTATRALALTVDGAVTGYGVAVEQGSHEVIGPVVAASGRDAMLLVRALLTHNNRPRRIDVPSTHGWLIERLVAMGFKQAEVRPVMSLGGSPVPGDLTRLFALAAQAFG